MIFPKANPPSSTLRVSLSHIIKTALALATFALTSQSFGNALANARSIEGASRWYGPQSTNLLISEPTIRWEVWGEGPNAVSDASVKVDGAAIDSHYDAASRTLLAPITSPLSPGRHSVECKVLIGGLLPMHRQWSFNIAPNAAPQLTEPCQNQAQALTVVNSVRGMLGLPPATLDPTLCAIAQAHARAMDSAKLVSHGGVNGEPFLSDRLAAYGWSTGAFEDAGAESAPPAQTIDDLFIAPYHRIPFLQPDLAVGTGLDGMFVALDFSLTNKAAIVTSPADGQTNVPNDWDGLETPCPLRLWNVKGPVGFPLVIASFGPDRLTISDATAFLTDASGNHVPCFVNTPANDNHLDGSILVIPKTALKGTYVLTATLSFPNGTTQTKVVHFSTR